MATAVPDANLCSQALVKSVQVLTTEPPVLNLIVPVTDGAPYISEYDGFTVNEYVGTGVVVVVAATVVVVVAATVVVVAATVVVVAGVVVVVDPATVVVVAR